MEYKINHFILQIWRLTLDFAWTLGTVYLHPNQLSQTKIFLCYWSNTTATCSSYIRALNKRFPRVSQDYFYIEAHCLWYVLPKRQDNSWKPQARIGYWLPRKYFPTTIQSEDYFQFKTSKNQVVFKYQWIVNGNS